MKIIVASLLSLGGFLLLLTISSGVLADDVNNCKETVVLNGVNGTLRIAEGISLTNGSVCQWNITGVKDGFLAFVVSKSVILNSDDVLSVTAKDNTIVQGRRLATSFGVMVVQASDPVVVKLITNGTNNPRSLEIDFQSSQAPIVIDPLPHKSWKIPLGDLSQSNENVVNKLDIQIRPPKTTGKRILFSPFFERSLTWNNVTVTGSSLDKNIFDLLTDNSANGLNLTLTNFDYRTGRLSFTLDLVDDHCSGVKSVGNDIEVDGSTLSIGESLNCLWFVKSDKSVKLDYTQLSSHLFSPQDELIVYSGGKRLNSSSIVAEFNNDNVDFVKSYLLSSYVKSGISTISLSSPFVTELKSAVKITIKPAPDTKVDEEQVTVKDGDNLFIYRCKDQKGLATFTPDTNTPIDGQLSFFSNLDSEGTPFAIVPKGAIPPKVITSPTWILRISGGSKGISGKFSSSLNGTTETAVGVSDSIIWTTFSPPTGSTPGPSNYWFIPVKENSTDQINGILDLNIHRLVLREDGSYLKLWSLTDKSTVIAQETFARDSLTANHLTQLPLIRLNPRNAYVLEYNGGSSAVGANEGVLVSASISYSQNKQCNELNYLKDQVNVTLTPPSYPNLLPLWDSSVEFTGKDSCGTLINGFYPFIHVVFRDIDVKGNQAVILRSKEKDISATTEIDDVVVNTNVLLKTTSNLQPDKPLRAQSGRGYLLSASSVACGGEVQLTVSKNPISSNITKGRCVWIIRSGNDKQIVNFTFSLGKPGVTSDPNIDLTFIDNLQTREVKYVNTTVNTSINPPAYSSSLPGLIIQYVIKDEKKPAPVLTVNFTTTTCDQLWKPFNSTARYCSDGKRCLLPFWSCNGVNDCGDNFDEKYCNGTIPDITPPKPCVKEGGGVSGWVIVLLIIPMSIGVGILLTLFGPMLLSKFRGSRYSEFRNFAEDT